IYISSHRIEERLAEVAVKSGIILEADPARSRCPECNGELVRVTDKDKVKDRVPPGSLRVYNEFYVCVNCGKVYWRGGHWRNIERVLGEARSLASRIRGPR
ncbi:MAG: hypothetical protein F7B18_08070, partial [Desulfurococcales archaeon]|nr:hypothetical protein [Desulfurococcales archaeon]